MQEICRDLGITRKTLFYYDRIGILKPTVRTGKQKAKEYDEDAVRKLEKIIRYQAAGLKLEEIRGVLCEPQNERGILIEVIRRQNEQISRIQKSLDQARCLLEESAGGEENNE